MVSKSVMSTQEFRAAFETARKYIESHADYYAFIGSLRMCRLPRGAVRTNTSGLQVLIYEKESVLSALMSESALDVLYMEENTLKLTNTNIMSLVKAFGKPLASYELPGTFRKWGELEKDEKAGRARTFEKMVVSIINQNGFGFSRWIWTGGLNGVQFDAISDMKKTLEVKGDDSRLTTFQRMSREAWKESIEQTWEKLAGL